MSVEKKVQPAAPAKAPVVVKPETKCIHCGRPEIGKCPRCMKYACIRQNCIEAHDHACPPRKKPN